MRLFTLNNRIDNVFNYGHLLHAHAAVAEAKLVANRGLDEPLPLPQLIVAAERVLEQLRGGVVRQHQARHAVRGRGCQVAGPVPLVRVERLTATAALLPPPH